MCTLVLGNLPDGIHENEIKERLARVSTVLKITFLENPYNRHSSYECLVELDINDPFVSCIVAEKVNRMVWQHCKVSAHLLLF